MEGIPLQINLTPGLIAIAILLLVNGVLAMAETALLSTRKARLQNEFNKGNARAGIALKLTENPNQFLSVQDLRQAKRHRGATQEKLKADL